jgi:hypothetical protein
MNKLILFACVSMLILWSCQKDSDIEPALTETAPVKKIDPLFQKKTAAETGIEFNNILIETPEFNYYSYTYLYNGSGVATADFNNDGLLDLFFVGAMSSNKLYINSGGLKFKDITAAAGVQYTQDRRCRTRCE